MLRRLGFDSEQLVALPGDVSPRQYVRAQLRGGGSAIASLYPEGMRDTQARFLETTELLTGVSVRVPRILANSTEMGVMVVEDLGGSSLFGSPDGDLEPNDARTAARTAQRIARVDSQLVEKLNPPLDQKLFRRELDQTWEVFLDAGGLQRTSTEGVLLSNALEAVCAELQTMPRSPCHRDFMVRNLMRLPNEPDVGVLDHQDLRMGPKGYDFASLACDSVSCTHELRAEIAQLATVTDADFDRLIVQRTFKIVGTFCSFARRGFRRYLGMVPTTVETGAAALGRLPEGQEFAGSTVPKTLRQLAAL